MAGFAHPAEIAAIPEQRWVALVWRNVVNIRARSSQADSLALIAQGLLS